MSKNTSDAGQLKRNVLFLKPVFTREADGSRDVEYEEFLECRANIQKSQYKDAQQRVYEANATALLNTDTVIIRFAEDRTEITKDFLVRFDGIDHIIHEIEPMGVERRSFIRFVVKGKEGGPVSTVPGGGGYPDPPAADKSHLLFDIEVTDDSADIVVVIDKTGPGLASYIDFGDGGATLPDAAETISEVYSYTPGIYQMKVWLVNGVTDPDAPLVSAVRNIVILKTGPGTMAMTVGDSLSHAINLRSLQLDDVGLPTLPQMPKDPAGDQVRSVSAKWNNLSGQELSDLYKELDLIGWPVGVVATNGNPGNTALTAEGTAALASLTAKGWLVSI